MPEYGFSLTGMLRLKDRIYDSIFIREYSVRENPYFGIFYAVFTIILYYFHYICLYHIFQKRCKNNLTNDTIQATHNSATREKLVSKLPRKHASSYIH